MLDEPSPEDAKAACDDLNRHAQAIGRAVKVLATVPAGLAADRLDDWFASQGWDGLNFALPADISALDDFNDRVLPDLCR
ncbi:nitrilotriacetate monooxygenase, partial [Mesorhizobium sp. M2D.F.Ca.ET.225.01.1.1]